MDNGSQVVEQKKEQHLQLIIQFVGSVVVVVAAP
jgi:hypothetical protein